MQVVSDATRVVTRQMEVLWDFNYMPSNKELDVLYRVAKGLQWDADTVIDWQLPIGKNSPVFDVCSAYNGTNFINRLSAEEKKEMEVRVASWRLSQFLHGEQGALMICGQLINYLPNYQAKLFSSIQAIDEARHMEVFEKYIRGLHKLYPVDPVLGKILSYIMESPYWEIKLLGMQIIVEGLALASFQAMQKQTADPALSTLLANVLKDESRHVNFGVLLLKSALTSMSAAKCELLEDFAWTTCDVLYGGGLGGFRSVSTVWKEMGWNSEEVSRDIAQHGAGTKDFNTQLFRKTLIPKLATVGLISERVRPLYERSGLLDRTD